MHVQQTTPHRKLPWLERFSRLATKWTGRSWAFGLALLVVLAWLTTGPIFHFSDTWQLVINTATTICRRRPRTTVRGSVIMKKTNS